MLVRAWYYTYNLPIVITNCTNNYGPRDWLYVEDHAKGIILAYEQGQLGESYCIGGHNEKTNLEVVQTICKILDQLKPKADSSSYANQITYVTDRAGHDYRYAMDPTKIQTELGWQPEENFESGIKKTVKWYPDNRKWVEYVLNDEYQQWINQNYADR